MESADAASAERAVVVEAGKAASHHVVLQDPVPPSGLRLDAMGEGLTVFVDGRDVGSPPVVLDGLEAGDHVVRIVGDDEVYTPFEQTLSIQEGETRDLGAIRLPVKQARLAITAAGEYAEGADVRVDGRSAGRVPTTVKLDPKSEHEVVVSREGFEAESFTVTFQTGQVEQTLDVQLEPTQPTTTRARRTVRRSASSVRRPVAKGAAVLNLNSIPVTRVILDGKVLGLTPVLGRRVSPGSHTAVFIHPDGSRKVVTTSVGSGQRKTAAVKF
jgi:serine/threonine-protein kinase